MPFVYLGMNQYNTMVRHLGLPQTVQVNKAAKFMGVWNEGFTTQSIYTMIFDKGVCAHNHCYINKVSAVS